MSLADLRYRTLIAGTDFTPLGDASVKAALAIAPILGAKRLHLVHNVAPYDAEPATLSRYYLPYSISAEILESCLRNAQSKLDSLPVTHTIPGFEVTREVRFGVAAQEIAAAAKDIEADLTVIATHGRGALGRLLSGSVAGNLIRIAPCPVLGVAEDRPLPPRFAAILAAIDLSGASRAVLLRAAAFAQKTGAFLRVVSFYERSHRSTQFSSGDRLAEHRSALEDFIADLKLPREIPLQIYAAHGHPAGGILEIAARDNFDLIAIGTSGHNAAERFILGSTATRVLAQATCPVLVVPNGA